MCQKVKNSHNKFCFLVYSNAQVSQITKTKLKQNTQQIFNSYGFYEFLRTKLIMDESLTDICSINFGK